MGKKKRNAKNMHQFVPKLGFTGCGVIGCGQPLGHPLHFRTAVPNDQVLLRAVEKFEMPADGYMPRGFATLHGITRAGTNAHRAAAEEVSRKLAEAAGVPQELLAQEKPSGPPQKAPLEGLVQTAQVQDSEVYSVSEYCDHPNGFGPMGCPCGASQPGENDDLTMRNLTTGEDELAIDCPAEGCQTVWPASRVLDHLASDHLPQWPASARNYWAIKQGLKEAAEADNDLARRQAELGPLWDRPVKCPECHDDLIKGNIRRHLQTVHAWTGDQWDAWAEATNFLELPSVPQSALDEMRGEESRKLLPQDEVVSRFMDPSITTEELMASDEEALRQHGVDPEELAAAMDQMAPYYKLEEALTTWWLARAQREAEEVVPKAVEYGSNSLMQVGRKMAQLQGREVNDDEALELGCWSYLIGKVERWTDAVMRGDRPSDDTLHDVAVYVKMAQRVRDVGSWPGV